MKYVFTGPPCSGKSSVYDKMRSAYIGYSFFPEVARNAIKHFKEYEPEKLPWVNRNFFQAYVETKQLQNLVKSPDFYKWTINGDILVEGTRIFDRGLVDEIGYRKYFEMPESPELVKRCLSNRYDKIFYFPFWEEIYKADSERVETKEQAELQDVCLREAYALCGYELVIIPKVSVKERAEFILSEIND